MTPRRAALLTFLGLLVIVQALACWNEAETPATLSFSAGSASTSASVSTVPGRDPAETTVAEITGPPVEVAEFLPVADAPAAVSSGQGPATDASPCDIALATVEAAGLHVPPGWTFACPAPAWGLGREHRGRTCLVPCFGDPGRSIEVNPALSPNLLGVVAHELCHAWDYHLAGETTEPAADRCAAEWGFPNG